MKPRETHGSLVFTGAIEAFQAFLGVAKWISSIHSMLKYTLPSTNGRHWWEGTWKINFKDSRATLRGAMTVVIPYFSTPVQHFALQQLGTTSISERTAPQHPKRKHPPSPDVGVRGLTSGPWGVGGIQRGWICKAADSTAAAPSSHKTRTMAHLRFIYFHKNQGLTAWTGQGA